MEQKFRKLLLQGRKSIMGELEYGPPGRMMLDYLQFSRGPQRPWIRWCNTAACWAWPLRTLRPGFPHTSAVLSALLKTTPKMHLFPFPPSAPHPISIDG